jgi:hypothetical protein
MNDKEKVRILSFEPAEHMMLRNISMKCMDVMYTEVQKMNLGDPVKHTLACYSIIKILKDSLELTMKEIGINNLEFVDNKLEKNED